MLTFFPLTAQTLPDSLRNKTYTYIDEQVDNNEGDTVRACIYINAGLAKAKAEKNWEKASKSYEHAVYFSGNDTNLAYTDSIVASAKKTGNPDIIASAYLTKGSIFYSKKKYQKALDNYIIANKFADNSNDAHLKYKVKYLVATIKMYLGFYEDAELLLRQSADYFKETDIDGYINSLHALGICYNRLQQYNLCTATNKAGLRISLKAGKPDKYYFIHSEGINQYGKKQYTEAIKKLNQALPYIIKKKDFANEALGYFYLGKSYLALGEKETSYTFFRKVDRIITDKDFMRYDLRENFELLIKWYNEQGKDKVRLHYMTKLMEVDKILDEKFKYLSGKVHKEYDTHDLIKAKKEVEQELEASETTANLLYTTITLLFFLILFVLYRYYINHRNYRQKFEELMQRKEPEVPAFETEPKLEAKKPDINPDVIAALLKHLDKFESQRKFLQKELTLVNLSTLFGTNTNYLSKTISFYRGKNYINYINDLRIDYIVELLKTDPKYRNYTIKALADEAGFSTAQHFSKAFFARTGIYPSYFINELSKDYNTYTLMV